MFRGF
ncbi:hypothetical protein D030_0767A, partial [Vibrio parahaemolyticus AQ3810]